MASGLVRSGEGIAFPYAGTPLRVLAGGDGDGTAAWAAGELVVPAHFHGPIPHVHETFDEALYLIEGTLLVVTGWDEVQEAPAGSLFTALRGTRHTFSNPTDTPARVLGIWTPAREGLDFMRAVGAVLPAAGPPDPEVMRDVYERHHSHLQP